MYKDEKFWDRIASNFDRIEQNDIAYKIFIEKASGYLKGDDTILDFGCGTGLVCNEIAGNVGFIHAIDISAKMIEISANKASERKIRNIEFEKTSVFNEKFGEGTFDAIVAFNVLHLLDDPQKYIRRLYQLLKPGGFLLSATPCVREAPVLNFALKLFSFVGLTPKLHSFTRFELEKLLLTESFQIIECNRMKPKTPQYLCVLKKQF